MYYLGEREDDEEVKEGGEDGISGDVEMQEDGAEVEEIGHRAESGDGDGVPAVEKQAEGRAADGERVQEERVDEESRSADEEQDAVPVSAKGGDFGSRRVVVVVLFVVCSWVRAARGFPGGHGLRARTGDPIRERERE